MTTRDKDLKEIDYLVEKLEISIVEAMELIEFDTKEIDGIMKEENKERQANKEKPKPKGIQENELDYIMNIIKEKFNGIEFTNKNLYTYTADKFSIRQTPSRLKKLVESGKLENLGGTPSKYKIKE